MEYIIMAFRSRNVTARVYSYLIRQLNINCSIISTPRACGVGCGLSIKLNKYDLPAVRHLSAEETFAGFFVVTIVGNRSTVTSI